MQGQQCRRRCRGQQAALEPRLLVAAADIYLPSVPEGLSYRSQSVFHSYLLQLSDVLQLSENVLQVLGDIIQLLGNVRQLLWNVLSLTGDPEAVTGRPADAR